MNGTVTCLENPNNFHKVQYRVDYNITNTGPEPFTFDHSTARFENDINKSETNLPKNKINKITIGAGKSLRDTYYTGEDSDRLLSASKNGKVAFTVMLYRIDEGLIFMQSTPLPSIVSKNGHQAELPPEHTTELHFTNDTKAVMAEVNA